MLQETVTFFTGTLVTYYTSKCSKFLSGWQRTYYTWTCTRNICTYLFPGFFARLRRVTFLKIKIWQGECRSFSWEVIPLTLYLNFNKFQNRSKVHLIHEHVHVTYDTPSLGSTLILAKIFFICNVHFIQCKIWYMYGKPNRFSGRRYLMNMLI